MSELPDLKSVDQLKKRIAQYEGLLAKRAELDQRLEKLASELGLVGLRSSAPAASRTTARANEARSLTLKRYWIEKKKKEARATVLQGQETDGASREASGGGKSERPVDKKADRARSLAMKKYWAAKKKAMATV
ncbi:MAG: hypothetical protein HYR55_10340 [Acidobacteria bacterium]|nr:hypothetical protein [Acidobacteriota bacterium]MBI3658787.1 hypothetical protein [Acidobacteriota bacterium]